MGSNSISLLVVSLDGEECEDGEGERRKLETNVLLTQTKRSRKSLVLQNNGTTRIQFLPAL